MNIRPYMYPYFQKESMEKIVKELLEREFIQPSQSPYSSPVILVKKRMDRGGFVLISVL